MPWKAASPVIILHRPALSCSVFVLFCPVKNSPNRKTSSLSRDLSDTEPFVFCDEMNASVGLVEILT